MDLCKEISTLRDTQLGSVPFHYDIILTDPSHAPCWLQVSFPSVITKMKKVAVGGGVLINEDGFFCIFPPTPLLKTYLLGSFLNGFFSRPFQSATRTAAVFPQLLNVGVFQAQTCGTRVALNHYDIDQAGLSTLSYSLYVCL